MVLLEAHVIWTFLNSRSFVSAWAYTHQRSASFLGLHSRPSYCFMQRFTHTRPIVHCNSMIGHSGYETSRVYTFSTCVTVSPTWVHRTCQRCQHIFTLRACNVIATSRQKESDGLGLQGNHYTYVVI